MSFKSPPRELIDFFNAYDTFYVLGHREPDGDCVNSQLALGAFLRRRGKTALLFSPGPFNRKEIRRYGNRFTERLSREDMGRRAGVVVVDCSSGDRISSLAEDIAAMGASSGGPVELAVIDHHTAGDANFGSLRYIDTASPCVTLMIQRIIEAFGDEPSREEAYHIFSGFATDTGFFRHLRSGSGEALALVARLVDRGVTPNEIYEDIFGVHSFASRVFIADILKSVELHFGGRFLLALESLEHAMRFQGEDRQTDMVYQLLLSTEGCEALAFIRGEEGGKTSVSLRSTASVDVGSVAQSFGGGGHKNAAGFTLERPGEEVRDLLLESFQKIFS
jgi:phosphoesterase RecJ-like protein